MCPRAQRGRFTDFTRCSFFLSGRLSSSFYLLLTMYPCLQIILKYLVRTLQLLSVEGWCDQAALTLLEASSQRGVGCGGKCLSPCLGREGVQG